MIIAAFFNSSGFMFGGGSKVSPNARTVWPEMDLPEKRHIQHCIWILSRQFKMLSHNVLRSYGSSMLLSPPFFSKTTAWQRRPSIRAVLHSPAPSASPKGRQLPITAWFTDLCPEPGLNHRHHGHLWFEIQLGHTTRCLCLLCVMSWTTKQIVSIDLKKRMQTWQREKTNPKCQAKICRM